jgi:tetratricopeptide (TPR) repeat protein
VIHAGTGEINFATVVSFLYILFLTGLLGLQAPLIAELIAQATLPDPSRNLRPLKVHTTAERKVAEQDLPGAIAEYEKIVADDPKDIDARFRLAELCCEHEEYRKAVAVYEALLGHPRKLGIGQHCSMLTRLSEIYARHLGDPTMARQYVQTIIDTHPGTKYAEYAEARLSNL